MRKSFRFRPLAFIDKAAEIRRRMGILTAKAEHQLTKQSGFAVHSTQGGLYVEGWEDCRYAEIFMRASRGHHVRRDTLCGPRRYPPEESLGQPVRINWFRKMIVHS